MISNKKIYIIFILILSSFTYGTSVGLYKIFPYNQIRDIKHLIVPPKETQASVSNVKQVPPKVTPEKIYKSSRKLYSHFYGNYDIVFLGDSITYSGKWGELFYPYRIANRGIRGDTSDGILNRLDSIISIKPKLVFLMFGINDLIRGESVEKIYKNYELIVKKLSSSNIKVVIQSTILAKPDELKKNVIILNEKLKKLAELNKLEYVDLNEKLYPDNIVSYSKSYDGIHLYDNEYLVWRNAILSQGLLNETEIK
jgi:lysophospholipase L1-like esterase